MDVVRGFEPIVGRRAVQEALRGGREADRLVVATNAARDGTLADILDLAARQGVEVERADPRRVDGIANTDRHQGVVLLARARAPATVQGLLDAAAAKGADPFVVCLDGVEDPQNLGAIARTALLAGATGLVVPERGTASVGPGAMRASAGALAILPVAPVSSLGSAFGTLKRGGVWIVGATAEGGTELWQARLSGPVALVLGSEHGGLSPSVQKALDAKVQVPTPGGDLSLNVSAAAAVLCFERVRQMRAARR